MKKVLFFSLFFILSLSLAFSEGKKEVKIQEVETLSKATFQSFTDSLGRIISLDSKVTRVIPGNMEAELFIYAIAPDKLVSISSPWPKGSEVFVDKNYLNLPVTGEYSFYSSSLNEKKIKKLNGSIIIILGQSEGISGGLSNSIDELSKKLDVPIVFIESTFETTTNTIKKLGVLLSEREKAETVAALSEKFLSPMKQTRNIVSVYYSDSIDGLTPVPSNSLKGEVISYIPGLINPVPEDFFGSYTLDDIVSLGVDKILLSNEKAYKSVTENEEWQKVNAVKDNEVYLVPSAPFNLLSEPASLQRILGLLWLRMVTYNSITEEELVYYATDYFEEVMHQNISVGQIENALNLK